MTGSSSCAPVDIYIFNKLDCICYNYPRVVLVSDPANRLRTPAPPAATESPVVASRRRQATPGHAAAKTVSPRSSFSLASSSRAAASRPRFAMASFHPLFVHIPSSSRPLRFCVDHCISNRECFTNPPIHQGDYFLIIFITEKYIEHTRLASVY